MKILPDYEHMEYRDVYTCRTYPCPALWLRCRCMGDHRLTSYPWGGGILTPDLFSFALLQPWFVVCCGGSG